MKSVMTHDFSRIPQTDISRSVFKRDHGVKTAFDSGYLVPIECQEVLPGDSVKFDLNLLARLGPCVTPPMDNVFLDTQAFFVPSRLIWNNFTKFMGERVNPKDSIDFLVPQIDSGNSGFAVGSLADYFGIPTNVPNLKVNALPFRAMAKIWDDWYRDENLQDSIIQEHDDLGDGNPRNIAWNTLYKRGKRHDYFTSCLPTPQKGEGVEINIGGLAPVYGKVVERDKTTYASPLRFGLGPNSQAEGQVYVKAAQSGSNLNDVQADFGSSHVGQDHDAFIANELYKLNPDFNDPFAFADLSNATAVTINSLRMAFQLQRFLERENRSGSRYVEIIRGFFNTICPDARLQRSEYLGGSSQAIAFNPITQTSESGSETPQGNLVSQGKVFSKSGFSKAFTEHGYIIILASVRCDLNYQNGLSRMWSRRTRYDFFWPTLQNLGEQAVLNKEIYAQGDGVKDSKGNIVDNGVFGYQERYAEYRYNPSIITGKMRSNDPNSLDVWHLAQNFESLPKLNADFIQENPPLKRILAIQDEPEIIMDCYIAQTWTRPMLTYSVPGLIDHM